MMEYEKMIMILVISLIVFVINVPFGYWRSNVKSFSVQWFLAIHLPVPFIVALRFLSGIGFAWYTYIFLIAAYFMGQKIGALLIKKTKAACLQTTSCLVMDVFRCIKA